MEKFYKFLTSSDTICVKARDTLSVVRRIGIVINATNVNDYICVSKIRDMYLDDFCRKKGYKPDSIRKFLYDLLQFTTFLLLRKEELCLHYLNEHVTTLERNIKRWLKRYSKASKERFWKRQKEDLEILVDDEQINIYLNSKECIGAEKLFSELAQTPREISFREYCLLRDKLFVTIELGNSHRSGVCANFKISEFNKPFFDGTYHQYEVDEHKTKDTHGPAVINLLPKEHQWLQTFVNCVRPQTNPEADNVFLSFFGHSMESGAVSRQLASLWVKIGILKKTDKNLSCTIIRKSSSKNLRDKGASKTKLQASSDLMGHALTTQNIHYALRDKQQNASAGSSAIRKANYPSFYETTTPSKSTPDNQTTPSKSAPDNQTTSSKSTPDNQTTSSKSTLGNRTTSKFTPDNRTTLSKSAPDNQTSPSSPPENMTPSKRKTWGTEETDRVSEIFIDNIENGKKVLLEDIRKNYKKLGLDVSPRQLYDKVLYLAKTSPKRLKMKQCASKEKKGRADFTPAKVEILKERCSSMLNGAPIKESLIRKYLKNTDILEKYSITQIRTRITYQKGKD